MFDQNPRDWMATGKTGYAVIQWLARGCANTVEVFLHKRMGHRYLGIHSLVPLLIMFVYAGYWASEGYDVAPISAFIFIYAVALTFAMAGCAYRRFRGGGEHSRYNGLPRFFKPNSTKKEMRIKEVYEPLMAIAGGLFLADLYSPPLGLWFVLAGVCLGGVNSQLRQIQSNQNWDLQDVMIEQRFRMEEARVMQRRVGL
jgi:hypothetical protein